jgi:hypothetical protein
MKLSSHKAFGHDLIDLQMQGKMLFIVGCFLLSIYFIFFGLSARIFLGSEGSGQLYTWVASKALSPLLPSHELSLFVKGKLITASAAEFARSKTLQVLVTNSVWKLILAAFAPLPVFAFFPRILAHYSKKETKRIKPKYIDGAKLLTPANFKKQIDAKYPDTYLPFGGWYDDQDKFHSINLPTEVENAHVAVYGGTRSGKTVLLSQMIHAIRQRGDIALILDQKGDYCGNFYDPEMDHILNVLDQRCMPWSFWLDLEPHNALLRKAEIETVAAGLIPDSKDSTEQFFRNAARDVLAGLLSYLEQQGKHTYTDLWQSIKQPRESVARLLADTGHRGHIHVSEPGKQSQGVLSVLMEFGKVFEYASVLDASNSKFSIQDWFTNGKGYIYLTNYDSIRDILRPMLSLFINFLAKKILSAEENIQGRRIWLFLDEFGSLHKLSTLIDILTRGGSKGVCVVLATQDRGQVEEIYGPNLTDAIFNSCNSWAAFRCKDPSTARIIVDRIGEWRFERQEESVSDRFDDGGDSINISKRIHREKLLLDSEIMGQEKLQAYIHVDGCDFTHAEIEHKFFDPHCPAFIPRTDVDLPEPDIQTSDEDASNITVDNFYHNTDIDMEVGV